MLKIVSSDEMRFLDSITIEELSIPGMVLMENAGRAVYNCIDNFLKSDFTKRIIVLSGKGNNGGDGFVVARHLFNNGYEVCIYLLSHKEDLKGDALLNFQIVEKMGIFIKEIVTEKDIPLLKIELAGYDLIVDGLLGTGIKGGASGFIGQVINIVNETKKPVIAIDTPSGLDCTSGKVDGPCIKAFETVTFGLPKRGMFIFPGRKYLGRLLVADISIPRDYWMKNEDISHYLITPDIIGSCLPERELDCHKGDCGKVFIVAGSTGYTGAAALSSLACLKTGAGLVTLGVPEGLNHIFEVKLSEIMTVPLEQNSSGTISMKAFEKILSLSFDVLAIGPGLSRQSETAELVRKLISSVTVPMVIDADGLNALAEDVSVLAHTKAPVIITPHPGEMARLASVNLEQVKAEPVEIALEFAKKWKILVILKTACTIVATPEGKIYFNPTGNPGMATGGSGDVLTGIIASFLGQGLSPVEASLAGVFIHGLSGDLACKNKGEESLIAGDLIDYLPQAFKKLRKCPFSIINWIEEV